MPIKLTNTGHPLTIIMVPRDYFTFRVCYKHNWGTVMIQNDFEAAVKAKQSFNRYKW